MKVSIKDIIKYPLRVIPVDEGNVMHGIKNSDNGFIKFGEAYFSFIKKNRVKAWKKHSLMQLNLIVPKGLVLFVFFDAYGSFREEILGENNNYRLMVPPGFWFGFKGIHSEESVILNISNIIHDDNEVKKKKIEEIEYNWML